MEFWKRSKKIGVVVTFLCIIEGWRTDLLDLILVY